MNIYMTILLLSVIKLTTISLWAVDNSLFINDELYITISSKIVAIKLKSLFFKVTSPFILTYDVKGDKMLIIVSSLIFGLVIVGLILRVLRMKNNPVSIDTIIVFGSLGKMGSFIKKSLDEKYHVVGVDIRGGTDFQTFDEALKQISTPRKTLLIDFSQKDASYKVLIEALNKHIRVISGTTGFSNSMLDELRTIAKREKTSLVICPNFSCGISYLWEALKLANWTYFRPKMSEYHHFSKKDAPSGTAKLLAKVMPIKEDMIVSHRVDCYIPTHLIEMIGFGESITIKHEINTQAVYLPTLEHYINKLNEKRCYIEINFEKKGD